MILLIAFPAILRINSYLNLILLEKPLQFSSQIKSIYLPGNNETASAVSIQKIRVPSSDTVYGKFEVDSVGISYPLVFGDDSAALKKGAAQYMGSYLPGFGGTVLIAGHNYKFRAIGNAKTGELIKISTSYGVYQYRITSIQVLDKNNSKAYTIQHQKEQLIFYTCYPFNALGSINTRFFVYADLVSGPKIVS